MSSEGLPLSVLFRRSLKTASKAYLLPTNQKETQELVQSALSDLQRINNGIESLSLFSPNESLDDLATGDIVYLLVPYVISEMLSRIAVADEDERQDIIRRSQRLLQSFIEQAKVYSIVSQDEINLTRQGISNLDPASRREIKIQQYKKEKELKARIDSIQKNRMQRTGEDADDFTLIASLLKASSTNETLEDNEEEENLRTLCILAVKYYFSLAHAELKSMGEELELLRQVNRTRHPFDSMLPPEPIDDTWKLDQLGPRSSQTSGPLMDSTGKPLRPFVILPGTDSSERARLRAEVFRPDHRLPTMTIDEYLQEEKKRGNIISGGGSSSADQPSSSERLALDAEMDGSILGELKSEEKRRKDEEWAMYTDNNPKGTGNTLNRG